jgi:tripartite-type tricarboxylate transporter receptor subunit TctC
MKRHLFTFCALAAFALSAHAQAFPARQPIKLVVPFAPGGATDVAARIVATEMGKHLGQTVIVENKPGGAGALAAEFVARATPDGYTLCFCTTGPITILHQVDPKLPYQPARDLLPVSHVHNVENVILARTTLAATNLRELSGLSRAREPSFGSPGAGGTQHLAGEWLAVEMGIKLMHVPYKGETPAFQDLAGGQIDLAFGSVLSAAPLVKDGKVRAIANLGFQRSKLLPDVPTVAEQGYPNYAWSNFVGVHTPAGTPRTVIDQVSTAVAKTMKDPAVQEKFTGLGLEAVGSTPEEYAAVIRRETANWERVLKTVRLARE